MKQTLTPKQYREVRDLFQAVCDWPPNEQAAYIHQHCDRKETIAREVHALLCVQTQASQLFPEDGISGAILHTLTSDLAASSQPIPESIGPYRIIRKLGEGGMGVVFEAEQQHPKRRVALKVLRLGMFSSQDVRQRFDQEAYVLGRLHHHGIAQIYEAGSAPGDYGDRPFLAMELVAGPAIHAYASAQQLSSIQRIELVAQVCDAVHAAHQRGVIHRDLKPGNILMTEEGQPKVLDFGVARLIDRDLRRSTIATLDGQLIGTVCYMSPEQVSARPEDLDTRSDVYALGVILFELLTGELPYDIRHSSIPAAVRAIREQNPRKLSSLDRTLQGDWEIIVGKALAKDPDHRYASAAALAADLRHGLSDEPIQARPPSAIYQIRKFTRRNKGLAIVASALVLVLIGSAVIMTALYMQSERARVLASRETAKASATQAFLFDNIINAADPNEGGQGLRVVDVLRDSRELIDVQFADQPEVAAAIHLKIGSMYQNLGDLQAAVQEHAKAVQIRRDLLGSAHHDTLQAQLAYIGSLEDFAHWDDALTLARDSARLSAESLGDAHPVTLGLSIAYGHILQVLGQYQKAEQVLHQALTFRGSVSETDIDFCAGLNALGASLMARKAYEEAEQVIRQELACVEHRWGVDHTNTMISRHQLGVVQLSLGKYNEAIKTLQTVVDQMNEVLPKTHWHLGIAESSYGLALLGGGRLEESARALTRALDILPRATGEAALQTHRATLGLFRVLCAQGRHAQAEALLRKHIQRIIQASGEPNHPYVLASKHTLAKTLIEQNQLQQARSILNELSDYVSNKMDPTSDLAVQINATKKLYLTAMSQRNTN